MPVVPISRRPGTAQPQRKPISAADEPWVLMAAAEMDKQQRLVEPTPKDAADGS